MTHQDNKTVRKTGKTYQQPLVSLEEVKEAEKRLKNVVKKTPVDTSTTFAELSGAEEIALKLENFQRTGAFKLRGAYNKLSQLSEEDRENGVVAASSGNHAQGVALASQELELDAKIVMPEETPKAKVEATKKYGAEVVLSGENYDAAYEKARELEEDEGRTFVHPYNERNVVAGQGTLGLELLEQYPDLEKLFVAVGGGGLISGVAAAVKTLKPSVEVIGVQTEGCGTAKETLEKGRVAHRESVDTVAKGIATKHVGEIACDHFQEYVDDVVYVNDREVEAAVALLAERQKVVAEPAGATALAAVLFNDNHDVSVDGEKVATLVCGGNTDFRKLGNLFQRGKQKAEELR